jgi:hypothetical protein
MNTQKPINPQVAPVQAASEGVQTRAIQRHAGFNRARIRFMFSLTLARMQISLTAAASRP